MNKAWQDDAWEDYLYWQTQDKKTLKKFYESFLKNKKIVENENIGVKIDFGHESVKMI